MRRGSRRGRRGEERREISPPPPHTQPTPRPFLLLLLSASPAGGRASNSAMDPPRGGQRSSSLPSLHGFSFPVLLRARSIRAARGSLRGSPRAAGADCAMRSWDSPSASRRRGSMARARGRRRRRRRGCPSFLARANEALPRRESEIYRACAGPGGSSA